MKIPFSNGWDHEFFQRTYEGKEVTGVIAVSACRMRLQLHRSLLPHDGLQKVPHQLLELHLKRHYHLVTSLYLHNSFSSFLIGLSSGRLACCPSIQTRHSTLKYEDPTNGLFPLGKDLVLKKHYLGFCAKLGYQRCAFRHKTMIKRRKDAGKSEMHMEKTFSKKR